MKTRFITTALAILIATAIAPVTAQASTRNESNKAAKAFVEKFKTLVGKSKEEVVIQVGTADTVEKTENLEVWKYRKLFGNYQEKTAIFGRLSKTWEVKLELVFKDGIVVASKPGPINETRLQRADLKNVN